MEFCAQKVRKMKPWMKKLEDFFTKVFYRPCCIIAPIKRSALWGLDSVDIPYLTEKDINWLKSLNFEVFRIDDNSGTFCRIRW